jgi:hypothetical protein
MAGKLRPVFPMIGKNFRPFSSEWKKFPGRRIPPHGRALCFAAGGDKMADMDRVQSNKGALRQQPMEIMHEG